MALGAINLLRFLFNRIINNKIEINQLNTSGNKQIEQAYISADILTMLSEDDKFHSLVFDEYGVHLVVNE